jgi:hypothetical protein
VGFHEAHELGMGPVLDVIDAEAAVRVFPSRSLNLLMKNK